MADLLHSVMVGTVHSQMICITYTWRFGDGSTLVSRRLVTITRVRYQPPTYRRSISTVSFKACLKSPNRLDLTSLQKRVTSLMNRISHQETAFMEKRVRANQCSIMTNVRVYTSTLLYYVTIGVLCPQIFIPSCQLCIICVFYNEKPEVSNFTSTAAKFTKIITIFKIVQYDIAAIT
jgi:hypothetical protein